MRAWEAASWQAGCRESDVIAEVGRQLAARLAARSRPGDRVLLLAGRGHNGDDVRAMVPHLPDRDILSLEVADPTVALPGLEAALARSPAWVVDGLFGIGLNRDLDPAWIRFIETVNASGRPVVAVDVPSGLDADTGRPRGTAIRACLTLTVGAPKQGLLPPAAWEYTGRTEVVPDVGLIPPPEAGSLEWVLPGDFAGFPPAPAVGSHKGDRGQLLILAGAPGYHGAAVLAARAAQRARPGLITLGTVAACYGPVAAQLQAVMVDEWSRALAKRERVSAVLAGPGLAGPDVPPALREAVQELWRDAPVPVVVDASALDWLPPVSPASQALRVVTPHPGEAARMLGQTVATVQGDREAALQALSRKLGGVFVVLKGLHTLTGVAGGRVGVNSSGNPGLAQGGTGDVLAGYLAGLLAQPPLAAMPGRAIRFAVWQHGAAADAMSGTGSAWVPEELVTALGGDRR
jgi:NAD(P)H-hydrate epimerase